MVCSQRTPLKVDHGLRNAYLVFCLIDEWIGRPEDEPRPGVVDLRGHKAPDGNPAEGHLEDRAGGRIDDGWVEDLVELHLDGVVQCEETARLRHLLDDLEMIDGKRIERAFYRTDRLQRHWVLDQFLPETHDDRSRIRRPATQGDSLNGARNPEVVLERELGL